MSAAAFLIWASAAPVRANIESEEIEFFSSIQDMPLMPGLTELPEQTVVFDKPQGRIIESLVLADGVKFDDIAAYYEEALPQFGWQSWKKNTYVRDGEYLALDFENFNGRNFMRVMVVPRP